MDREFHRRRHLRRIFSLRDRSVHQHTIRAELHRDRFNKSLQATLISSREITLDGHTGLEFTSETPAANVKSQLFLVGQRLFQTAAVVFKDVDQTRYVDRFFGSFKLTADKQ